MTVVELFEQKDLFETRLMEKINNRHYEPYIYTYPPKGAFRPNTDSEKVQQSWRTVRGPISLYLHIPFCEMKCSFCTLFTTVNQPKELIQTYVKALEKEFEISTTLMKTSSITVNSIYFGGGTPTLMTFEQMGGLLKRIKNKFRLSENAEIGLEGAPNSIGDEKIREIQELGFNRLSIGIQSFDETLLRNMGRHYGAALGIETIKKAVKAGIPNVNFDLIYGIPGQTFGQWKAHLETAVQFGNKTITIYPLVVRDRAAYGKKYKIAPEKFLTPEEGQKWYDFTLDYLEQNDFSQHTLVTFARRGGGNQHEENEFRGLPTLGLGAGARSYTPNFHYTNDDYFEPMSNQKVIERYLAVLGGGRIPVFSGVSLDEDETKRRYFILNLLFKGVDERDYLDRFDEAPEETFGYAIYVLRKNGFMEQKNLQLNEEGKKFSSVIGACLFSEAVQKLNIRYK